MISPAELLKPASEATPATRDRPVEHLMACHRRIEERLATLERAIPHLESQPKEALQAIGNAVSFLESNGAWHTQDEEESFFPRLAGLLRTGEVETLATLERQHKEAEALFGMLRACVQQLSATPMPASGRTAEYRLLVRDLCQLYRQHIATEDACFRDWAGRLPEDNLRQMAAEMKQRRGIGQAPGSSPMAVNPDAEPAA